MPCREFSLDCPSSLLHCTISAPIISPLKYFWSPYLSSSSRTSRTSYVLPDPEGKPLPWRLCCRTSHVFASAPVLSELLRANVMPGSIFQQRILLCLAHISRVSFLHTLDKENILFDSRWEETNFKGMIPVASWWHLWWIFREHPGAQDCDKYSGGCTGE